MKKLLRRTLWLWPALLAGAALRFYNLPDQILVGDEAHTVRLAVWWPVGKLLVTYLPTDFSQPLTAVNRLLMNAGVRLSEMHLRAPSLAAGLAAIVVLPWLVERWTGRRAATVLAWLIACSPLLVLYSRLVRSYLPMALAAGIAVFSFFAWLDRPSVRRALGYALAAPLAVYLHLVAAPVVATPFLYAVAEKVLTRRGGPSWRALLALGAAAAAGVAAFVLPAWPTLSAMLEAKQGEGHPASLLPQLALHAGVTRPSMVGLFWLAAAVGLVRLLARRPRFGLYTAVLAAAQVGALAVMRPYGSSDPLILNRYLLVLTPIFLTWVAVALSAMAHRMVLRALRPWRRLLEPTFVAAFVLALIIAGPFTRADYRHTSWLHHADYLDFRARPAWRERLEVTPLLASLRSGPPGPVLHAPYRSNGWAARALTLYQQAYRRPVRVSTVDEPFRDPRLALRNFVAPTAEGFLASDARYLVLHRDREAEESAIGWQAERLVADAVWEADRAFARRMLAKLRADWGPPDLADSRVSVWDLERVRGDGARAVGGRAESPPPG